MEKVTFGDDMPGYVFGPKEGPAVVVIQVPRHIQMADILGQTPFSSKGRPSALYVCHRNIVAGSREGRGLVGHPPCCV